MTNNNHHGVVWMRIAMLMSKFGILAGCSTPNVDERSRSLHFKDGEFKKWYGNKQELAELIFEFIGT